MSACRVKPLLQGNLAPEEALRHPAYFEWRDVEAVPGEALNPSGCQNLRLECINCGWAVQGAVPPAVNGITMCPDCEEDLFRVTRLFERCMESVPGFAIRRTKAGYIHIDGWQHLKDAAVYYTCDGQDPSAADSRFTRPFKPDFDGDAEIRAVCYWGEFKSQVVGLLLQDSHPPKSYQCRYCKHFVEGYGERIICPTCGVTRVMYANGSHADEAPAFKCPSCGAEHLVAGLDAMLHCVTCGAEYKFSNTWEFACWLIVCPACRNTVSLAGSSCNPRGGCTCPECRSTLRFNPQSAWQVAPTPQVEPSLPPQRQESNPVPPITREQKQKQKSDSSGCGCLILIAIIIFVILCMC